MARKRRFSDDSFGPTIERLMGEAGLTYRSLAEKTSASAGYLNHLVHGNRPVPSDDVIKTLARALGVEAEHFREYRLRVITDRLERMPDLIDKLYRRYGVLRVRCPPRGAWRSLVGALAWGARGPQVDAPGAA